MPSASDVHIPGVRRVFFASLLILLSMSSCDCEETVRKWLSNPGDRKKAADKKLDVEVDNSSAPSEKEPNNFAEQATLLELGGDLRPVEAEIASETDRDWFALTSRNNESWQVEVAVTPKDDSFDPVVRVALGDDVDAALDYNIAGAGEPEVVPILAITPEPTRIYVRGHEASKGAYEITFKKRLSGGSIEAEPNDDVTAAEQFRAPGEIQGFYDRPNDRDIYYVPRKELTGEVFKLEVSPIGLRQTVTVYGSRELENPLVRLDVPAEESAHIPNLEIAEGALGIWIVAEAGEDYSRERSYRLRLLPHSPESLTLDAEPNDTAETAQEILLGDRVGGYLHRPSDVDRFRIYMDELPTEDADTADTTDESESDTGVAEQEAADTDDGDADSGRPDDPLARLPEKQPPEHMMRVELFPDADDLRLGLAWYDKDNSKAPTTYETEEFGEGTKICNHPQDEGSADVEVRLLEKEKTPVDTGGFDYRLRTIDVATEPGLELEPNDSMLDADRLEASQSRTGYVASPGDRDVYGFAVRSEADDDGDAGRALGAEPKRVELTLEGNKLDLVMEVRDDEGGRIAESDDAGVGGDETVELDLPPGLYYVRIFAESGFACEPYKLSVSKK